MEWLLYLLLIILIVSLVVGLNVIRTILRGNRFREVEHTNESTLVQDHIMVEKEDPLTKTTIWRSAWWIRDKLTLADPPKGKAVALDNKGRKHAVGYKIGKDQFVYIKNEEQTGNWEIVGAGDRHVLLNQIARAEEERNKKITASEILQIASTAILGLVIIIAVIFGADIMNAYKGLVDQSHSVSQTQLEVQRLQVVQQLALLEQEGIDISKYSVKLEQNIPQQKGGGVNG
jgi:hypothetical protein